MMQQQLNHTSIYHRLYHPLPKMMQQPLPHIDSPPMTSSTARNDATAAGQYTDDEDDVYEFYDTTETRVRSSDASSHSECK